MVRRAPQVLRERAFPTTELRALRAQRRGRVRLILEVSTSALVRLLDPDEDRDLIRESEYATEDELFSAFERAATALAR